MTGPVAVVTDSASSLPPALARTWGIAVVPLQVIIDDVAHPEGAGEGAGDVLDALVAGRAVSTSQPTPAAFDEAFAAAAERGCSAIVAVLISGAMSGTVNVAMAAAERAALPVTVVDSRTLAMATGYAALAAAATAKHGGTPEQVSQSARDVAASSLCVFTVDTLEYLRRGGRVSPAVAAVGTVLSVRPVLGIVDGEVQMLERVRTTARARQALMHRVGDAVATLERPAAAVLALGDESYGDDAARTLEARHPDLSMVVRTPVSAVLAVHAGPGTLAAVAVDLPAGIS